MTNQFTDEQLLAALNAYSGKGLEIDGYIPDEGFPSLEEWGDRFTKQMRAALEAAAGVAPQAPSEPLREALKTAREHFTAIAGSGEIQVWGDTGEKRGIDYQASVWAKRGERVCREALAAPVQPLVNVLESPVIENRGAEISTPVQPSSTVGVGKIADEMERHHHVMVAPGPHQCSCSFVMSEDPGFSGWAREHKLHVARAVVEAIGGESHGE